MAAESSAADADRPAWRAEAPHPDRHRAGAYALLVTYQLLRTAMADATTTRPGTDPDRTSYKATLNIDILTPADP